MHEEQEKQGGNSDLQKIRKFVLDAKEKIVGLQKGRITRLIHPICGDTYLIDVTDKRDPTRYNPNAENPDEETSIDKVFSDREERQGYYANHNGVTVLVTNKLDPENRSRVYVGFAFFDPNSNAKRDFNQSILCDAGFQQAVDYVPFSSDQDILRKLIAEEIKAAGEESGQIKLPNGLQGFALP